MGSKKKLGFALGGWLLYIMNIHSPRTKKKVKWTKAKGDDGVRSIGDLETNKMRRIE
jgi:hypothetical protein